jgi:4-hydroxybenzoate polyprenyltransferase
MREALDYARERLLDARLALVTALLVALARFAAPELPAGGLVWQALAAGLAVVGFRIWDDLADLPHDSVHHAERVLVKSAWPSGYALTSLFLLAGAAALIFVLQGKAGATTLALAAAMLGLVYRLPRTALRQGACLAKYPAIVFAIVPAGTLAQHPARLLLASGLAWAAVAANDVADWIMQRKRKPT